MCIFNDEHGKLAASFGHQKPLILCGIEIY